MGAADLELGRSKRLKGLVESLPGDPHLARFAALLALRPGSEVRLENPPRATDFTGLLRELEKLGLRAEPVEDHLLLRGGAMEAADGVDRAFLHPRHEIEFMALAGHLAGSGRDTPLLFDPAFVPGETADFFRRCFKFRAEEVLEAPPGAQRSNEPHHRESPPEMPEAADAPRPRLFHGLEMRESPRGGVSDESLYKVSRFFQALATKGPAEMALRQGGPEHLENLMRHFGYPLQVKKNPLQEMDELARRIAREKAKRQGGAEGEGVRHLLAAWSGVPEPQFLKLGGDFTAASILALAATVVKGSDITVEGALITPSRAAFLAALKRMGADIEASQKRERYGETFAALRIRSADLVARRFSADNLAGMKDEAFLLIAAAAFAEGETVIRDIGWLRSYREDRLKAVIAALKAAGVEIGEVEDGLVVRGKSEYDGNSYDTLGDPALGFAYWMMAAKSHGRSVLANASCLEERFPGLLGTLKELGGAG